MESKQKITTQLPKEWKWIKLGEVCLDKEGLRRGPFGSAIKKEFFVPTGYKVYEQANAIYDDSSRGKYFLSEEKYQELINFNVQPGDLIVSCSGTLGRIAEIPKNALPGVINQALLRVRLKKDIIEKKYFLYNFRSAQFQRKIFDQSQGTAMSNLVGIKDFKLIGIFLPSLLTQQAIVSVIEELFSELDKGIENLNKAKRQLITYRQSVLKWAFEGKENASIPFSDIVLSYQNGISKRSDTVGKPFKVLRLADVKGGEIYSKDPREIKLIESEINKYKLYDNDIIAIRVNGSKELVGRFVLVNTKEEWAFCDHFIRIRLDDKKVLPKLIKYYAESRFVRRFIELNMVSSAGQNTISQTTLSSLEINLPSIEEQYGIVQEIESRLSVVDKMEESINQSLQQGEALRQSILKKAFEGRLV